ncbi:Serpentine Receptor, class BC (Class B-like) [Caenorhabditis elegans]|uniref:Serpentine Receptor, class BC (Class B-like) n=1 Tax=Caenorhabditis elegans TaxID=6239 RepID=Q5FAM6_CAEEL|nr:Serpentine Receptor, class BC (Class B-like) [Caenorhabditis elegans]CCD72457.1 Serpentine Receptor, class BC (Class B-like) [Caenorhabditis elegans]|eukprot:NP_503301.2 Serpentine Receptor, class BC (class B-like) [Caenorhabditis elegans]
MKVFIEFACLIGLACAIVVIILNLNLICKFVLNNSKRKNDMHLFYFRFVLDILLGISFFIYIGFSFLLELFPEDYLFLIVLLGLLFFNVAATRSIIALTIGIERTVAAYFPKTYQKVQFKFLNWIVISGAIIFGGTEPFVLFGFCSYQMEIPSTCRFFGCAINTCFNSFWSVHRTIIFTTIVILSILLAAKLFILNHFQLGVTNKMLSKANRLALIDVCTVFIFDIIPAVCGNLWPIAYIFSFDNVGPYNFYLKIFGCSIETIIVSSVIMRSKSKISKNSPVIAISRVTAISRVIIS